MYWLEGAKTGDGLMLILVLAIRTNTGVKYLHPLNMCRHHGSNTYVCMYKTTLLNLCLYDSKTPAKNVIKNESNSTMCTDLILIEFFSFQKVVWVHP